MDVVLDQPRNTRRRERGKQMKKLFEVELRYTSYTVITIEADTPEQAEALAWEELATDGSYRSDYGDWTLESIEEMKQGEAK